MNLLFVIHDGQRTGSNVLLLRTVGWLKKQSEIGATFLFLYSGPLIDEFSSLGEIVFWSDYEPIGSEPKSISERIATGIRRKRMQKLFRTKSINLIYANSLLASPVFLILKSWTNIKVVWHIHELENAIQVLGSHRLDTHEMADHIIANSASTKRNLIEMHGISSDKISIHFPFFDAPKATVFFKSDVRKLLKLSPQSFIVGAAGTTITRKGSENFIILADTYRQLHPGDEVVFVWLGSRHFSHDTTKDLQKMNLGNIQFIDEVSNPADYYRAFDLFVSTSKEESFGLAALEAAKLGTPIMGFEHSGGLEELLSAANGVAVPYLNLLKMTEEIKRAYSKEYPRKSDTNVTDFESSRVFSSAECCPLLHQELLRLVST